MVGIYKIKNTKNNKIYVGQSTNIEKRWSAHRNRPFNNSASQYDSPLYRAIRKYGLSAFVFEVIEECSVSLLNEREQFYIQLYQANNPKFGYNLTIGGQPAPVPSKLSSIDINNICTLLLNTDLTEKQIAEQFGVSQRLISGINLGQYHLLPELIYPLRSKKQQKVKTCIDCGKEISKNSLRCKSCSNHLKSELNKSTNKPSRDILKNEIRTIPFTHLSKKYGVSDKAIVKWCISYNLPSKKSEIKSYTDEQWSKI